MKLNLKTIYTYSKKQQTVFIAPPPLIHNSEQALPHNTLRTLAQLRAIKSPFLHSYLDKINHITYTTPIHDIHDTFHIFTCPEVPTTLALEYLWSDPSGVSQLLGRWGRFEGCTTQCRVCSGVATKKKQSLLKSKILIVLLGKSFIHCLEQFPRIAFEVIANIYFSVSF